MLSKNINQYLNQSLLRQRLFKLPQPAKVLYVASYVPRKCGIATFTRDLTQAINFSNPLFPAKIMVLNDKIGENLTYPKEARFLVKQNSWEDYEKVINYINSSSEFNLVCIQHEFGIFGGGDGSFALRFLKRIHKPVISTLHTVVPNPSEERKEVIRKICSLSSYVVVMLETGAQILSEAYGVTSDNIRIIPHGVPNFPDLNTDNWKEKLGLKNKVVMTSINLLSPSKGVEFAIKSLPEIIKDVPNFVYQIVGETHPNEIRNAGGKDLYREKLMNLTKELNVEKHVQFVNKYVSLEELVGFIGASDFYVTSYIDPQQITSGALAYAIGAGKVCISTPYIYANEMLGEGRGVIVPFEGSSLIAKAVINLVKNPQQKKLHEEKTYQIGKSMTWDNIAYEYINLFNSTLKTQTMNQLLIEDYLNTYTKMSQVSQKSLR